MTIEKVSNLKKALCVLIHDQYDAQDLDADADDDTYVDYIIGALIEANDNTCPFKNYSCTWNCKSNNSTCEKGLSVDCERELEGVWKEFIGLDSV